MIKENFLYVKMSQIKSDSKLLWKKKKYGNFILKKYYEKIWKRENPFSFSFLANWWIKYSISRFYILVRGSMVTNYFHCINFQDFENSTSPKRTSKIACFNIFAEWIQKVDHHKIKQWKTTGCDNLCISILDWTFEEFVRYIFTEWG